VSMPLPIGLITPIPVTTTRRFDVPCLLMVL
jgi:hypothetical protein